jgi:hypothetical protein
MIFLKTGMMGMSSRQVSRLMIRPPHHLTSTVSTVGRKNIHKPSKLLCGPHAAQGQYVVLACACMSL